MKVWTSIEKADDKVIAYESHIIYKGNPKPEEVEATLNTLKTKGTIPVTLAGFPLSYIKEINLREGENHIELLFGKDSTEELTIIDTGRRREIFDYFKTNIPNVEYTHFKPSAIQSGKKPLIAFIVVAALFTWTLYLALGIESGNDYEVSGQRYNSIAGIVLAIASIGVTKVVFIFGSLLTIALLAFIKKARNPVETERLIIKRNESTTFSLTK